MLSRQTVLIIEAIRAFGKERITTADIIAQLQNKLPECDKKIILDEAKNCSKWIYEIFREICKV